MGSPITNWADATGAIFQGAGTSMPMVWFLVALGLCILALVLGGVKEASSYK